MEGVVEQPSGQRASRGRMVSEASQRSFLGFTTENPQNLGF